MTFGELPGLLAASPSWLPVLLICQEICQEAAFLGKLVPGATPVCFEGRSWKTAKRPVFTGVFQLSEGKKVVGWAGLEPATNGLKGRQCRWEIAAVGMGMILATFSGVISQDSLASASLTQAVRERQSFRMFAVS
jgi:hypothetical protein